MRKLFVCLFILIMASTIFGREAAFKDGDGKWQKSDESQWKQVKPGSKGIEVVKTASITFIVAYKDVTSANGLGFDDPVNGANRRFIVSEVLTYIGGIIDEAGTCNIEFQVSQTDGGGALANGGTIWWIAPSRFDSGFAYEHITTGSDPSTSYPDIQITFDFGFNWNSTTGTPTVSQIDLYSVLLHETTHGLGLLSLVESDGTSSISGSDPGVFSEWDDLLITGNSKNLFGGSGDFLGTASDLLGGDGGIKFTGTNATASYGSNPPIYAPATWASGSSISHWASSALNTPIMTYSIGYGDMKRTYAEFEIQALKDIGYDLKASPVENWNMY